MPPFVVPPPAVVASSTPPGTNQLWLRTDDHLEAFIDYRTYPDGDAPDTTPVGGLTIIDASDAAPPGFYGPLTVVEGSLRTASNEGLGVLAVYALPPRTGPFRITVGLADFTERTGTPPRNSSNITITDLGGNGPILHVGYPEPDGDGGWMTTVVAGWDVNYEPVLGDPVFVPRLVGAGDRFGLGFDGTHWTAYLNGEPVPGIDPWPHDDNIVTIDQLEYSSNPLGGLGGTWLAGTQWWALTDGDTDYVPDAATAWRHDGDRWVRVGAPSPGEIAELVRNAPVLSS